MSLCLTLQQSSFCSRHNNFLPHSYIAGVELLHNIANNRLLVFIKEFVQLCSPTGRHRRGGGHLQHHLRRRLVLLQGGPASLK